MTIGIVMPARNAEGYIEAALESLLRERDLGLDIVVVDDHSTDGTVAAVERVRKDFDEVRIVHNASCGVASA